MENFHAAPQLEERLDPLAVPDPITLNAMVKGRSLGHIGKRPNIDVS